ncbi:HNH endonuclease [Ilumatobacter nonamiensis]|uniref:HNH endonuclease n=1 Tax=Ilumatobacter nonamiensis TaxID=467093 RepID=UPI000348A659|nr:HNH endonuclease signature motif containing protein [Ilumatobacter nonamiensis]
MKSSPIPTPAEVDELSGAELDQALVELEAARRTLEATYVAVLDRADATERYRHDGHVSVRGWSTALTNASPVETRRRLQTMRALRDLPEARDALADASIGVDQVRAIAQLHASPRLRDLVVDGDAQLVEHAGKDFVTFSEVLHRWNQFGDPQGDENRHAQAHDRREAMVFERDGVVHVHAKCGAAQGAALMEMFQKQCDAEFLSDWEAANAEGVDCRDDTQGDPMSRLARTDAQRRMDALHRLIVRGAAAAPGAATPDPLVNIVITKAEYESELAAMMGGRPVRPATIENIDTERCDTSNGVTLSPRDAVIASMIGEVRRVVIDSAGRVTDLGRRRRFTGAARDAVLLDGRRCLWPGCGRDSQRNQIDHTHEYSRGGTTTPHNGGPMCGRHNRFKSQGYTAHRDADGTWHVHRPDGTELTQPAFAA